MSLFAKCANGVHQSCTDVAKFAKLAIDSSCKASASRRATEWQTSLQQVIQHLAPVCSLLDVEQVTKEQEAFLHTSALSMFAASNLPEDWATSGVEFLAVPVEASRLRSPIVV